MKKVFYLSAVMLILSSCSRNFITDIFKSSDEKEEKEQKPVEAVKSHRKVGMLSTYPTVNEQVRTFLDFKKLVTCRPTLMSAKVLNQGYSKYYSSEYAGMKVWRNDLHPLTEGEIKVFKYGNLFCHINSVGTTDILYYDKVKMLLVFGEYANEAHLKVFNLQGSNCFSWGWVGFSKDPSVREGILDYLNQLPLCKD